MRYSEDNLTFPVSSCFLTVKPAKEEAEHPGEWAVNLRKKVAAAIQKDNLKLMKALGNNSSALGFQ